MIGTLALLWLGGAIATFCHFSLDSAPTDRVQGSAAAFGDLMVACIWPLAFIGLFWFRDRIEP
jgi:hypothetical protein